MVVAEHGGVCGRDAIGVLVDEDLAVGAVDGVIQDGLV
jgi:hypothetical protein